MKSKIGSKENQPGLYDADRDVKPQKLIKKKPDILEKSSKDDLVFLIKEQRKRIQYLSAELDFFKTRVLELEAEQESDLYEWRQDHQ